MDAFLKATSLMLILLNPFLVIIYVLELVQTFSMKRFAYVMFRAGMISSGVFVLFAILGDAVFSDLVQARFASFQVFGGIVFLLIGIEFVFKGQTAMEILRGDSAQVAGAVAMPVLIGPGTISAAVVAGKRLEPLWAVAAVVTAVFASVLVMLVLKWIHDVVKPRKEVLVERYIEVMGRVTALVVGTFSVEMIMQGLQAWARQF